MDDYTTLLQLKEKIRDFCEERDWDQYHNAKDLAIGIITEAAELLEHFRFKSSQEVDQLFLESSSRSEIAQELADILYFVLRLSERYGIDLSEELTAKLSANAERYPIGKSKGSNKKYSEFK
jgi:NTP pyrophosphatase (non-canonical NTP hydrolase)